MTKKAICIYHAKCMDGFGAAAAVYSRFGEDVEMVPCSHGDGLPVLDYKDKYVVIVDFSFSAEEVYELVDKRNAKSVFIIDHHISAQKKLSHLPTVEFSHETDDDRRHRAAFDLLPSYGVWVHFDMNYSGAQLTWRYFHEYCPDIINYIGDQDLWKFELTGSKEINQALRMRHPPEKEDFDSFLFDLNLGKCNTDSLLEALFSVGRTILTYRQQIIDDFVSKAEEADFEGDSVFAVNCSHHFASEVGSILAKDRPFAICYNIVGDECRVSLRSDKNNPNARDVSVIAEEHGGGGHKNAAGLAFKMKELF